MRSPQRTGLAAKPLLLTWTAMLVDARGYAPAEGDPCVYHGVTPFDQDTGQISEFYLLGWWY